KRPTLPRIRIPRPHWPAKEARAVPVSAGVLGRSRKVALVVIAALVGAASAASFAESYRALYDWAAGHGLSGLWAAVWPLQVDVFIAVGELALFVGLADGWSRRSRIGAWTVTLTGLAVSVAGNVGHVASHVRADRVTAAVPPLAAAAALAVGLGVLKRVVGHRQAAAPGTVPSSVIEAAEASMRATVAAGNPLSVNQLAERFSLTRAQATKVRTAALAESNGHLTSEQEAQPQ
ncbi:MAG: DUF2637 domain-containing protein, partial [Streptosporangiaceae bacterium]